MTLKPFKSPPALIALGVILLVCLLRCFQFEFFERLERMTFDMRAREALKFPWPTATNLGLVFINEESLREVKNGSLGFRFDLFWPRQVYGRLVAELYEQGARAVAFDVLLGELRNDPPVQMANGKVIESDDFLAMQMRRASNVIIAVTREVTPPPLFLTNAAAVGDITTEKDPDGILRKVAVFRTYRRWHPAFLQAEEQAGAILDQARIVGRELVIPRVDEQPARVQLDENGNFDLTDLGGDSLPAGTKRKQKPFVDERAWHMGIVLAARELGLDLDRAEIDLPHGRITLRGPGIERIIPVDHEGYFYVDWALPAFPRPAALTEESIHSLLAQNFARLQGKTNELTNRWKGKLAVVGSSALAGNNLTDRGATPLARDTILVSKHWNVANSVITGRFVRRTSLPMDLVFITLLGAISAALSWRLPVLMASGLVLLSCLAYGFLGVALYVQTRVWIPLVLPLGGAGFMTYVCTVAWRVLFEQAARRRVRSIFSTIVSPKIVHELLEAKSLSLGGVRREITVLFADVRGFTEFTDNSQERVSEFVREQKLSGAAAEACFDEQARETLGTVNLYLGSVADTIIKYDGTLDKFIGDCVMAFWGAPTPNSRHAVACVRAAVEAQRAIYNLNAGRAEENRKRELENLARKTAGLELKPTLPLLMLGTGINTGMATVGLMGSEVQAVVRQGNYTVFGREVNLASRLEGLSGRGRIFISEATHQHLLRDAPDLAATCVLQPPQKVKGISSTVKVFEVPWRAPDAPQLDTDQKGSHTTEFTSFVQR